MATRFFCLASTSRKSSPSSARSFSSRASRNASSRHGQPRQVKDGALEEPPAGRIARGLGERDDVGSAVRSTADTLATMPGRSAPCTMRRPKSASLFGSVMSAPSTSANDDSSSRRTALGLGQLVEGEDVQSLNVVAGPGHGAAELPGQPGGVIAAGHQEPPQQALLFLRNRADWPSPRPAEIRTSFWRLTGPGRPTRTGRPTPTAAMRAAHALVVVASKQIWVMIRVASGAFCFNARSIASGEMAAWPSG